MNGEKVAELVVDLIAHALAHLLDGIENDGAGTLIDAVQFVVGDGAALLEWIDAGAEQYLVSVGVADAGDDAAAGEHALDLTTEALKVGLEVVEAEIVEHVGSLLGKAGDGFDQVVGHVVELAHLPIVDVAQVVAAREGESDAGPFEYPLLRGDVLDTAGELGVDDEGAVAGQGEEQELAAPTDGQEFTADSVFGEGVRQGTDDAGFEYLGFGDGLAGQARCEELNGDVQFGGFGHGAPSPGQSTTVGTILSRILNARLD